MPIIAIILLAAPGVRDKIAINTYETFLSMGPNNAANAANGYSTSALPIQQENDKTNEICK